MSRKARRYERIPELILFQDKSAVKETYGGSLEFGILKGHHLKPLEPLSDTIVVFMHPIGGGEYLPLVTALAGKGIPVFYCDSRYPNNDSALIMEKVVIDLGNCIRHAREKLGYNKVVLGGWSGGGSLSLFYQQQAERATITSTPAGDPLDMAAQDLVPAQGLMLLAAHVSRAHTLTEWMDASILDESDPGHKDPTLDLYNPENENRPPYSASFLQRYRQAQIARNRRITTWVMDKLAALTSAGRDSDEYCFVVHGTMADPRWLDPTVDPNDRRPGQCYLGDPAQVNNGPVGLARFSTLRSWMSQWSYDHSNANGLSCAEDITIPVLVIGNSADDACTPSHTHRLYEAIGHDRKEMHEIIGANHYYIGQPDKVSEAANLCLGWLRSNHLL